MLTRSADRGIVELTCSPPYDEALASALLAACEDIVEAPAPLTAAVLRLGGSSEPSAPGWPEAVDAVASLPLPTVAVLADDTIGPTWELALACDLRIAASAARLGVSEVPPPSGTARRLAGMVGTSMALRLVLFGEVLDAAAAMELGLVQRVA